MISIYNNINKYRKTINILPVQADGTPKMLEYFCPLSDIANVKFIRAAAIDDGSCMLHSIFTYQDKYKALTKSYKEKFIRKLRTNMASSLQKNPEKIWQNIDNNYEIYIIIRNNLEILEIPISTDKILYNWGLIVTEIERVERKNNKGKLSIKTIQTIIHTKFLEYLKNQFPTGSLLLKSYVSMSQLAKKNFRKKYPQIYKKILSKLKTTPLYEIINLIDTMVRNSFEFFIDDFIVNFKDPSNWLGIEELRFIQNYLNINIFFLQGNNYGMPYILGDDAKIFYKPRKNNLILIWSGVHYELISIINKDKMIYKFDYNCSLIKKVRYLVSTRPKIICQKNILLSPFYKECNSKLSMTKIKKLVRKFKKKGEKNIVQKIQLLLENKNKFKFNDYKSRIINKNIITDEWKELTTNNIRDCFLNSYLDFNKNKIIEITKNSEQVAVAFINIKNPIDDINNFGNFNIPKGKFGYIHTLCVSKNNRGQRICKKYLIKAIIKWSKKLKLKFLILAVYSKNKRAIKCYEANRFEKFGGFFFKRKKAQLMIYKIKY